MYQESDLLPLSGLQHLVFCERQCALIHIEQIWRENILTAEGRLLHERVDSGRDEHGRDVRVARGLPIRSHRLGLAGRADVVEFHRINQNRIENHAASQAVTLPGLTGVWRAVPVEYKRGKPKYVDCDRVQLCAQALCLEEMLDTEIESAQLFYGRHRRRIEVPCNAALRERVEDVARRFHDLVRSRVTPLVYRQPKCRNCSLLEVCLPPKRSRARTIDSYLRRQLS